MAEQVQWSGHGRRGDDLQAQIWAFLGPIWVRAGHCLWLDCEMRVTGMVVSMLRLLQHGGGNFTDPSGPAGPMAPSKRAGAVATYVQQRGGGDFTGLSGARPGLLGLVCPCCRVRSALAVGGGGSPPGGCSAAALRLQWPGMFSQLRSVGYRLRRWRLFPPAWLWTYRPLSAPVFSVWPALQCLTWCDDDGDFKTVVAHVGGQHVWWRATVCQELWFFGGEEKSLSVSPAPTW